MNVLITGASGFVGQHLLRYLRLHFPSATLYAPVRKTPGMQPSSVHWIPFREDMQSYFAEYSIEAVIHLLGKAHDTKNTTQAEEYFKVNDAWTRHLYDLFLQSNATKFIFLSTIKAVGDDKTYVQNAKDVSDPQTPYAKSKKQAEDYIRSCPLPQGKAYYILRPTLIYGPGIKGNLATLVKFAKTGIPYPFSSFENKRSYLSINNLNYLFVTLLKGKYSSFTLNVANRDPISTQEMIELLANEMGKKPSLIKIPTSWIQLAAKMGDLFPFFPFNSEKLKKITSSFVIDPLEMEQTIQLSLPEQTRTTITGILKPMDSDSF